MRQSKFLRELLAEARQTAIREVLEERFGAEPVATVAARLIDVTDLPALSRLHRLAIRCTRLEEVREQLHQACKIPSRRRH